MVGEENRIEVPPPGAIAWLDVDERDPHPHRTGPLAMRIAPLPNRRSPYFFKGGRLRGTRCIWSASTLNGAQLHRPLRQPLPAPFDTGVHVLVRGESDGSVFDPVGAPHGVMRVFDAGDEIDERADANTHLFTLNVPAAALGLDASTIAEMQGNTYDVTQFQAQLLRGAVGMLLVGGEELATPSRLVGVDRYLAALAALLLRTAVVRPTDDIALGEQLRVRTDAIIDEQATDPTLSPTTIAAQLDVSLRQLYRAFTGTRVTGRANPAAPTGERGRDSRNEGRPGPGRASGLRLRVRVGGVLLPRVP